MGQAQTNPFPYSNTNKRYHTYAYYLQQTFGGKCAKLPIDAGLTCPNIDGRCGVGGCTYCSGRGSGDFALGAEHSVTEQIRAQRAMLSAKWDTSRCIAYFQAHTNTYAPLDKLKDLYQAALNEEGIVGLNIATRADCLEPEVVEYLAALAEVTTLTVELGLQTVHDDTAQRIHRGHTFADFCQGYWALRKASSKIRIGIHLILGLPGEDAAAMMESVDAVAALHPNEVKLHLLHVLRGSALALEYQRGEYSPLEKEEYIRLVADALERLPADVVIGRLTGDGAAEDLLAPMWSRDKKTVINAIDRLLYSRGTYQGILYEKNQPEQ
ncbi:MAG: TIGR01212 family radical SAM protein [Clostridia bacterium]|nr:TIGR01212 family radical SAM protein [Clostridia bacterium]